MDSLDTQCSFRKGHSTVDQIWMTHQVVEKVAVYQLPVYISELLTSPKTCDSVDHTVTALVAILRSYGVPHQLVDITHELYTGTGCHVRT